MRIKVVACIGAELYAFKWRPYHKIFLLPWQPCLKTYCVYLDRENKDNEKNTKARILTDKLYIICIIKQEQNQSKRVVVVVVAIVNN